MSKPAKQLKHKINQKSWKKEEIKAQVQEIVDLMSSSLENADKKIEEIKSLCAGKNCGQ